MILEVTDGVSNKTPGKGKLGTEQMYFVKSNIQQTHLLLSPLVTNDIS